MRLHLLGNNKIALGFMIFSFYLGTGNIITPPMVGYLAGQHMWLTLAGFLITAVALPLLGLLAVTHAGKPRGRGRLTHLTRYLPASMAHWLILAFYIMMGPAFAIPRTSLVAYEVGFKPWLGHENALLVYSLIFFALVTGCALHRRALVDVIGKLLTPTLCLLISALVLAVMVAPHGAIPAPSGRYADTPFIKGMQDGYGTMDVLASLLFTPLVIGLLRQKGITRYQSQYRHLLYAGGVAAVGLAIVYFSLFRLGNTADIVAADISNGSEMMMTYVDNVLGQAGQLVLTLLITLACFTTAVGLLSACAEYLYRLMRCSYRQCVVLIAIECIIIANIGLALLVELAVPVLVALYPVATSLLLLNLLHSYLPNPQFTFRAVSLVALLFGCLDGLTAAGITVKGLSSLPLFDLGLAWLIPTLGIFLLSLLRGDNSPDPRVTR